MHDDPLLAFVFDLVDCLVGPTGGLAPSGSSLGGELLTLLRDASAKLPQHLPLVDILSNRQPDVDHPLLPFRNAALDQPISAEMAHPATGGDKPDASVL